jgi:hypothetical protein
MFEHACEGGGAQRTAGRVGERLGPLLRLLGAGRWPVELWPAGRVVRPRAGADRRPCGLDELLNRRGRPETRREAGGERRRRAWWRAERRLLLLERAAAAAGGGEVRGRHEPRARHETGSEALLLLLTARLRREGVACCREKERERERESEVGVGGRGLICWPAPRPVAGRFLDEAPNARIALAARRKPRPGLRGRLSSRAVVERGLCSLSPRPASTCTPKDAIARRDPRTCCLAVISERGYHLS